MSIYTPDKYYPKVQYRYKMYCRFYFQLLWWYLYPVALVAGISQLLAPRFCMVKQLLTTHNTVILPYII